MDSRILQNNDRSRMNWTPVMERHFIDLMLDQLHRGNRIGHTFNKQAWTDMLTMFNARCGTKYDLDALKSHYSNLWKQYNDVKILLEQNGFSWDDTQKIVIASDDAWDTVIKAHPDAQYYRKNFLKNFNDMCLIYAYTAADGRYSRSSHDIDMDDDIQGLSFGVGLASFPSASTDCVKAKWTSAMDQFFLELMLDQIRKGNKTDNTFSKQAWKDMLTLFNAKFCSQYGKYVLKRRYRKLFQYYSDMKSLLERKEFSWDGKHHKIVAEAGVWNRYIKVHPDLQLYRKKTLLNFQDLSLIYGNELVNEHQGRLHPDKNFENATLQMKTGTKKNGHSSARINVGACWTSSMDHYFIDLLQNQALIGNKTGHELTTEAWVELVRLFKAKFGSQYDEDILKNQFNHLRMQHNDIKFLLEQNGFSWDATREMVAAEACVWDSYTKVYPHIRTYVNKSFPSYHKLCVIYGEENSNGRDGCMGHNAELDNGPQVLMVGEEDVQCLANGDFSKPDWTPSMDRYFIDLLLDLVHRGKKINDTLDNQPWIDMAVLTNERFGLQHDKDILKWRHKSLGKLFNGMKNLLDQNGFSWNETQQLGNAEDNVWDTCTKEHSNGRSYRSTPKPDYNDLYLVYGNLTSNEGHNQSVQGAKNRNSHSWKTNWTPPMDRFFIDLMLEHVRQGSMVNQRFNRQAWSDIVAKFSAAFGCQHDNDVLKRRFMILRKRFNDMKNLLDDSGFTWDELRQMIVADDGLWNAYVQNYPEAHPYRRTLPNYNDLFLIYATNNEGARHPSSYSMVATGYVLGKDVAQDGGPTSADDSDPLQIRWTKSMEIYFIDLMLRQVLEGNKTGQTFNEQAWAWIIAEFNDKFGLLCDRDAVESWYLSLMKEYNSIADIVSQNGFAWDDVQQMVVAADDDWDAYVKEHPGAMKYRDRILGSYNDLCAIYGHSTPVGRGSHLKMEIDNNAFDIGFDGIFGDAAYLNGELEISDRRQKRKAVPSSMSASSREVQRSKKEGAQEALNLKQGAVKSMGVTKDDEEHISIEVLVDALQAIPGMDDEIFLNACKLLENEERAELFVAMGVNQRRKWLFRRLSR